VEIKFRPHHFLCALCFQGKGYSPQFVDNFSAMMAILNAKEGEKISIQVTKETDSICEPCPHRLGKMCQTEEKIAILDAAHANALGINDDEKITWGDAKKKIHDQVSLTTFHRICATCSWKKLGICESVLRKFLT
jgi:hypothetical protein